MTLAYLVAVCSAVFLLLSLSGDAAANVNLKLASPRIALTSDVLELAIVVTPKQSKLKQLLLETLVDTSGATVLSGLTIEGDGSKFVTTLTGDNRLQAGMYKLKVSAADDQSTNIPKHVLQLKVVVPVEVKSAKLNGNNLKMGEKLMNQVFSAAADDSLKMELKLQQTHDNTPILAHQAFLRFVHTTKKTDAYFVLTAEKGMIHRTTLQFTSLSKKFGYNSGNYQVELIIGASIFEKAIVWDLGIVELLLDEAPPTTPSPLYKKPLLHESDTTLKALPEIKHVMREQDPRPPVAVSLFFMGAVLAPLAFFVLFAVRQRLNIKRLFEGSIFGFGCVFLASLGGIFALFGLYWLELTMFRTLGYLSILGFVNLWSGHLTLKRLAESSTQKFKVE